MCLIVNGYRNKAKWNQRYKRTVNDKKGFLFTDIVTLILN